METGEVRPNTFLVGAAKSGTTSLVHLLGSHAEIFVPKVKEPSYFIRDFGVESEKEYLGLYRKGTGKRILIDGSTGYLFAEESSELIRGFSGESAKILIILREPARMAYSFWRYNATVSDEEEDFLSAVEEELSGARTKKTIARAKKSWWGNYLYVARARYYNQVKRYVDCFGESNVCVMIFEELLSNPTGVLNKCMEFLGTEAFESVRLPAINEGGSARYVFVRKIRNRRYPTLKKLVPYVIRYRMREWTKKMNLKRGYERTVSEEELKALSRKVFLADVEKTSKLLRRNLLEWWKYDE